MTKKNNGGPGDNWTDWKPTAENINALPEPIRSYIHGLASLCDPAGIVADNACLRDQNLQLQEYLFPRGGK